MIGRWWWGGVSSIFHLAIWGGGAGGEGRQGLGGGEGGEVDIWRSGGADGGGRRKPGREDGWGSISSLSLRHNKSKRIVVGHKHVVMNDLQLKMIVIIWYLAKAGMLFLALQE
jgi:hypothetical protein